jgi:hypothetical protein
MQKWSMCFMGLAAVALVGCDQLIPETETAAPSASAVAAAPAGPGAASTPPPMEYNWQAAEPAVYAAGGPGVANLTLSGKGSVNVVFFELSVKAGETVAATFNGSGDVDKLLRVVLVRHCNPENGEDASSESFKLTAETKAYVVRKTFEKDYGCVRVSFLSNDGSAMKASIANLVVGKE